MTNFERDWIYDSNYVVEGANFTEQARYHWFRVHRILTGAVGVDAAGAPSAGGAWTLANASDGSGGALGAGTIVDISDFVFAAAGSNHTWLHYSRTNLITGQTLHLVIDLADGTDPRSNIVMAIFPGNPTGAGTATARPTHTDEQIIFNAAFFPNTTFVPRHVQGWRTTIGEFLIAFCRDGIGFPESAIWLPRFDDGEAAVWPFNIYVRASGSGRGALDQTGIETSGAWFGFNQASTPLTASKVAYGSLAAQTTNWSNGRSSISGEVIATPLAMFWNNVVNGYPGRIVDIRACSRGVPDNETPIGDADPEVYITLGELAVPWRVAAGAMVV